jgi:hypothetical protein
VLLALVDGVTFGGAEREGLLGNADGCEVLEVRLLDGLPVILGLVGEDDGAGAEAALDCVAGGDGFAFGGGGGMFVYST